MPEYLTMKERIERRIEVIVNTIEGIGTVERWSALGNTRDNLSAVIIAEDERAEDGGLGDEGTTTNTLSIGIELCIAEVSGDDNSSIVHNHWLGKLKKALLSDPNLIEADTGKPLAVDMSVTGTSNPPVAQDQPEFYTILFVDIVYDEYRDDPYTAPGITTKEA